jgi:MFS family permease
MSAAPPVSDRPAAIRDLLRHRNYCLFLAGDFVSLLGNWTQRIAIGWLTWQLTESTSWLGIIAFADLFPSVVLSPFGGVLADRGEPRRICFNTQSVAMVHATALFVCSATGLLNIWLLVVLVTLRGSIAAMNQPARFALIPSLIPRDHIPIAMATNSVSFNLARFIGPAIAGLVIVRFGVSGAFAVNAISYVALLIALGMIDVVPVKRETHARPSMMGQIVDGYRYVSRHAGVGPILLLFAMGSLLVRPLTEMLPGFADGVFKEGAAGLAWLTAAMGIGATLGGVLMVRRNRLDQILQATNISLAVMAVAGLLFAVAPFFWLAVALTLTVGCAISVNGIGTQTLTQSAVDDDMRGRVMSLYGTLFRAGPAVGAVVIGAIGDHIGLAWPTAAGALICGGVWIWSIRHRAAIKAALMPPQA